MVDRLRNSEANIRRISNVEACFGSSGSPLQVPGRVLVGEGVLIKMCRKKPKPRQFFLFNDLLIYGSIILSKKRYNKQHLIPLEEVKLENLEDEGDSKHGWLIKTRTKSFAVYAATDGEKNEWMLHIERCVLDLISNGRTAATEHAAVWVPDQMATKCQCCHSTRFTVIQRRHHCRACGNVVCKNCSNRKFLLPGISTKAVRVCNTCYNRLCQGMSTTPPPHPSALDAGDEDSSDNSDDDLDLPNQSERFVDEEGKHEAPTFYNAGSSSTNGTGADEGSEAARLENQ